MPSSLRLIVLSRLSLLSLGTCAGSGYGLEILYLFLFHGLQELTKLNAIRAFIWVSPLQHLPDLYA